MYKWTQEQINFMRDALLFSDYYQTVADYIAPHLTDRGTLCDAGCGLGFLGAALLPHCAAVTCIDHDPTAMADLKSRSIPGITALCGDVEALPPGVPYDAMVFCLFGSVAQTLRIAKAQCRGKIFLVKRNYDYHRFSSKKIPLGEYNARSTVQQLEERSIPYRVQSFTADFGQPFRSMDDARRFFAIYNRGETAVTEEELQKRLVSGPSPDFPLYLPHTKYLQLFTLDAKNIL